MSGISNIISKLFWLMIFILFSLIVATLVGSNSQLTTIKLWPLPGQLTIVLWLPILLAFSTGLLIGAILIWLKSIASFRAAKRMRKQKKNNTPVKQDTENDSHLFFNQTVAGSALNSEKDKQPSAHLFKAHNHES